MKLPDRVLALLADHPGGLSYAEVAGALHVVHQQVDQCCRALAANGRIVRDDAAKPIRNRLPDDRRVLDAPAPSTPAVTPTPAGTDRDEASTQSRVAAWLAAEGWNPRRIADTASREHGTDVVAERGGMLLHVEVKGYPSTSYADLRRAHETKPTHPATQARQWFAGAVVKVLQLRREHGEDRVAVALPDVRTYRALLRSIDTTLVAMRLSVFLVDDGGSVNGGSVEAWWNPA
ncbi:hypothetical protein [Saccharothrix yanglingensis]|uniref:hypothetical protein n=1 Tax=Saccharothrix yanglingensis TaxID=659496 RepID=UPI0027D26456|nr:hypothetical protein [Saccharothrix yanglingensis]